MANIWIEKRPLRRGGCRGLSHSEMSATWMMIIKTMMFLTKKSRKLRLIWILMWQTSPLPEASDLELVRIQESSSGS